MYMFRAIWEFTLSADSAALSGNPQTALRFLGIHRKRCAFWGSRRWSSAFWEVTIESRSLLATLDNLIICNINIRYTGILPVVYHVSL